MYQLLSADLVYDDHFNPYLLEYNTATGFYSETRIDRVTAPEVIQSHLDIILETHKDQELLDAIWGNLNNTNVDLYDWEILYNEADGYNILKS